ncbi:MAG: ferredoxin family protein [Deltaproteobacteria bacterium]|nr:ferredoxin family protein [Deltaproteobacteria bacterium]
MTFVVTSKCLGVKDRSCVEVCPVDCFYDLRKPSLNKRFNINPKKLNWHDDIPILEEGEFDTSLDWGMLVINPDECINCGACVVECPVDAIFEDIEVPDTEKEFVEINAQITQYSDETLNKLRVLKKPESSS